MAYRSSSATLFAGTGTLTATAPAGVAAGDRLLAGLVEDLFASTFTPATGWSSIGTNSQSAPDEQAFEAMEKKVASGSDLYNFTTTAAKDAVVLVAAYTGRHATTAATVTTAVNTSANATPFTIPAASVTAAQGDDILVFTSGDITTGGDLWSTTAVPASYTERQDTQSAWSLETAYTRDDVSVGATGTLDSTFTRSSGTGASGWATFTIAIPRAPVVVPTYNVERPQIAYDDGDWFGPREMLNAKAWF